MRDPSGPQREWRAAGLLFALSLCLAAGTALADGPEARCRARYANGRVLVDVDLHRFLDVELLKLVKLGLEGHFRFELQLVRERPLWFDEPIADEWAESTLRYDKPQSRLVLDHRREVRDPVRLDLDRLVIAPPDPLDEEGRYRVELRATLQVVTPASLGRVAAWIAGRNRPQEEESSQLSERLMRAVADDLAREATCRCDVTTTPPAAAPPRSDG